MPTGVEEAAVVLAIVAIVISVITASSSGTFTDPVVTKPLQIDFPKEYSEGEQIRALIPIQVSPGSSDKASTFTYKVFQDLTQIGSETITIPAANNRQFAILILTTAQDATEDQFYIQYEYNGWKDNPWYTGGDDKWKDSGTIYGTAKIKKLE